MAWIDLIKQMKGLNPNKNFKLLDKRKTITKENQEAIYSMEKSWQMDKPSQILVPKDMEEEAPFFPQQSSSYRTYKPRATSSKAHQSSLVVSRGQQGAQGKNKTSFNQMEKEEDPFMEKLMSLVQEVHKSKK
ncbi:hypothetical protein O181_036191 [Austropuccinia psidii MF-1]|uniref:Uncharacterized protein n=1 Tax=Austropuccinia psidii MF-1 TaxID=1389203 RepID=A0A9Q3D9R1_9BASI|nr:hypothetical protein [Austropuccinia psidii MF-1]